MGKDQPVVIPGEGSDGTKLTVRMTLPFLMTATLDSWRE
jgi:hypothetical protein